MQIDITQFFTEACPRDYSASMAEIGRTAGADTWRAACDDAPDYPMLDTPEKLEAFRADVATWGAWDDAEIAAMNLHALFLQHVAGAMREGFPQCGGNLVQPIDWQAYRARVDVGNISGLIYPGDDGRVYVWVGS